MAALMRLLVEDARLEMPPFQTWFRGRQAILDFFVAAVLVPPGAMRLLPVGANGQPAAAVYVREADGVFPSACPSCAGDVGSGVATIVAFLGDGPFASFALPRELAPD